jgi:hypothetical protein
MNNMPRIPIWQLGTLAVMLVLWVGLSMLLIWSRGDPEALLKAFFAGASRPDAFTFLNRGLKLFWSIHTGLVLVAVFAVWFRRPDVLVSLLIGPAICLFLGAVSQQWSDPNWFLFVGGCTMGWLASLIVGLLYWGIRRVARVA